MLHQDHIPASIARPLRIAMINKRCIDAFHLVHSIDDRQWCVKILALHRITTPRHNSIGRVMRVTRDEVDKNNFFIEHEREERKELHNDL